jgi:exopolysaccharide biosynthesis protein
MHVKIKTKTMARIVFGVDQLLVGLVIVGFLAISTYGSSDYITQPASSYPGSDSMTTYGTVVREYNNYNITGYWAWIKNPVGHFRVLYPSTSNGSCEGYVRTSRKASEEGCLYATNGGPFIMYQLPGNPTCLGNVVSDGLIAQTQNTSYINFGLTQDGNYIMGLLDPTDIPALNFEQLVTGFGWLIIEGQLQGSEGGEIAPRTAIGTNQDGDLFLFEADGIEDSDYGLTLYQLAQWTQDLGAYNMVNLDGGGSSVTVINGEIADYPTCMDVEFKCERFVTTMTCIMP